MNNATFKQHALAHGLSAMDYMVWRLCVLYPEEYPRVGMGAANGNSTGMTSKPADYGKSYGMPLSNPDVGKKWTDESEIQRRLLCQSRRRQSWFIKTSCLMFERMWSRPVRSSIELETERARC
jgi:hypothetical protein